MPGPDVNLPNLVSHLSINLDGVNGAIADASRQGSSMGAALGRGVQRELRDLTAHLPEIQIDGNSSDLDRDLARVRQEMERLSNQRIGIDIPVDDAIRQIRELQPHIQRLSNEHPEITVRAATRGAARQLDQLLAAAHRVDRVDPTVRVDVDVDEDRPNRLLGILGRLGRAGAGAGATIAGGMAKASAAIGAVVPAAAGVVSLLEQVAPAAGVAVTGLFSVVLATTATKLAASGMGDALSAALDPDKAKEYGEALKALSPEARQFAKAVHAASPALEKLQQGVQDKVFDGLAEKLTRTGRTVLPIFRRELLSTADTLNRMGGGVLDAARGLGKEGALGQALGSASKGLRNLSGVPGVVVTALGRIGAAAGPSFEKLTSAAGKGAEKVGEKLGEAFKSGALQKAIEQAIGLVGELFDVVGNVGRIFGTVFSAAQTSGGGLVGTLKEITGAIADAVATPEVQGGLTALFSTMSTLATTVGPLLGQALQALGPVLEALGPPAETLIEALGDGLSPIIDALGPVLVTAAGAVGDLVEAAAPLLPVVGDLAAKLLPALTPLLESCGDVFTEMAPVIAEVAGILSETLSPVLDQLPGLVQPFADTLAEMAATILPVLLDLLVQLAPSAASLGMSFAAVLEAAAPLLAVLAELSMEQLAGLLEAAGPVLDILIKIAAFLAGDLATALTDIAIPAISALADVLSGDFESAADNAEAAASGLVDHVVGVFTDLPGLAADALSPLASRLLAEGNKAGQSLSDAMDKYTGMAVRAVGRLPGQAADALSGIGGALVSAGQDLISGLISGITSKIPSVRSVLSGLTNSLPDWKGPKAKDAKILTPAGRLLIEGLIKGIDGTTAKLRSRLESITKALPANVKSGYGKTLKRSIAALQTLVTKHDSVVKKLATAQKKLDDLVKARAKAASDITKGILDEANITSGHADVNSVTAITVELQQAVKATKAFEANNAKLKKAGLRSDLLQQIADAGVAAGGATAAALARATPAELKRINDLQAQLAKSAKSTGDTVGDALYGAGIRAAQGLVAGLKSQEKAIEKQMAKIAKAMLATVKKVHKTKSPSRAFADIGRMDMEGWRGGVLATAHRAVGAAGEVAGRMLSAASGLGGALTAGIPSGPQLAASYAGAGAVAGGTYHIHLHGSDATASGVVRELSWRGLVGRQ
ncbi:hypothetical protein RM863_12845 [Streptomyces sp. DSM 41014]|uniref:Phage tail protein n=1 Tax=Streptomyces hintoniae TaxID=3075521 RepID=A0ABU2UIC6_9ACTN|nr:hypothetical protein [Streptomyces sp. DSM 41014]MDT0473012.1 hypothetical protein [Streptomyces sp. DSM 41014]